MMKRLTKKIDNGRFVTTDAEARSYGETDPEDGFFYNYFTGEAVDKLAAYEDTGLEPADIEKLLSAVPQWISVEERLPELHVNDSACVCTNTILYRTQYKTVHLGYVIETAHNIETIDGFEQIIVDRWYDQSGDMIEDVTHWMPLPKAPKEDAE